MEKNIIKNILRENLIVEGKNAKYDKDYTELQTKLTDTLLKQSQVMAAAGLGDPTNASDRSLFSKKLRKDTNDDGGQYLFSNEDLAKLLRVVGNPSSYINGGK